MIFEAFLQKSPPLRGSFEWNHGDRRQKKSDVSFFDFKISAVLVHGMARLRGFGVAAGSPSQTWWARTWMLGCDGAPGSESFGFLPPKNSLGFRAPSPQSPRNLPKI